MRVLVVPHGDSFPWTEELARHGVHVELLPQLPTGLPAVLGWVRQAARGADLVHIPWTPRTQGLPRAFRGLGIPVLLEARTPLGLQGSGWKKEARRQWARAAARCARAIVASPEVEAELREALGIRGIRVLPPGPVRFDPTPVERAEAQRALGLPPARFLTLLGPLTREIPWEVLGLAQRRLPGVGLLAAGDGPGRQALQAMEWATRPSSPVVALEDQPEAHRLAVGAGQLGLAFGPSPEAAACALMGRRQLTDDPGWAQRVNDAFDGADAALEVPELPTEPMAAADVLRRRLEEALERERTAPLAPPSDLEAARAALLPGPALVDAYRRCSGS